MSKPVWDPFLTERDKQVFAQGGFGALQGYGKRPAVVVVDVNYAFCGERPEPILESIKRWRASCGEEAWEGVAAIRKLLTLARERGLPVVYTTGARREDRWDTGSWTWKNPRVTEKPLTTGGLDGYTIVREIAPQPTDLVILKHKPSAFFGTPLSSFLVQLGVDSILLTGTTTSGCVRATAIDAFSYNYRVAVVEEGCFDRSQASHAVSLADMHAKYADVVKLDDAMRYVQSLSSGMFDLPRGR